MSVLKSINTQFERMKTRNWDKIYYFFDIHETILYPDYNNKTPFKFYPHAKEVLQYLSKREDISINIYTCSYPQEIQKYMVFFKENGIEFIHINKNPEAKNTTYGYYEDKPYFNVLFEDKAGFDAETEWREIALYFDLQVDGKDLNVGDDCEFYVDETSFTGIIETMDNYIASVGIANGVMHNIPLSIIRKLN